MIMSTGKGHSNECTRAIAQIRRWLHKSKATVVRSKPAPPRQARKAAVGLLCELTETVGYVPRKPRKDGSHAKLTSTRENAFCESLAVSEVPGDKSSGREMNVGIELEDVM